MNLTSVEIHPDGSSNTLVLSFRDPDSIEPYNVKDIKGLDADDIIPQFIGSPGGSPSYNLRQGSRIIVLKMGLNPNYSLGQSVSDIRDAVYKMIASSRKGKVQIQFRDAHSIVAVISGYIAKFESERFTRLQEVQLTVLCDTTMLTAPEPVKVDVAYLDPRNTFIIDDLSTAPHGFTFTLYFNTDLDSLTIRDPNDIWNFTIAPKPTLPGEVSREADEVLQTGFTRYDSLFYSNEDEKQLYLIRGTTRQPLADLVEPGSTWPIIFPGENHFTFNDYDAVSWTAVSYRPTYWGV
jgi:hypothetical protein